MKMVTIQCYTTSANRDKAKAVARAQNRSVSNVLENMILAAHAELVEKKRKPDLLGD